MCGIGTFLSNEKWKTEQELSFIDTLAEHIALCKSIDDIEKLCDDLLLVFEKLMSFEVYYQVRINEDFKNNLHSFTDQLIKLASTSLFTEDKASLKLFLQDYAWQINNTVLDIKNDFFHNKVLNGRAQYFTHFTLNKILRILNILEIRGRDSSGISIQILVNKHHVQEHYPHISNNANIVVHNLDDKDTLIHFTYKTADLVGSLGDNQKKLAHKIDNDEVLWGLCRYLKALNIISHTRWASQGKVNSYNCHPLDSKFMGEQTLPIKQDISAVVNGDISNYHDLVAQHISTTTYAIDPNITSDSKLIPVMCRILIDKYDDFQSILQDIGKQCAGSFITGIQYAKSPHKLFFIQQGNAHNIYFAEAYDGILSCSEIYGLALMCRKTYSLGNSNLYNAIATIDIQKHSMEFTSFSGEKLSAEPWTIEVWSSDINIGNYKYFFEKEIHEGAESVRKTLNNKYTIQNKELTFKCQSENFHKLQERLKDPKLPKIKRIICIGQGTTNQAGNAIAHIMQDDLMSMDLNIQAMTAAEAASLEDHDMSNTLIIAISQSGSTIDTLRAISYLKEKNCWIHTIVNRRNSPIVERADSCSYTSNGRDIELSIASSKAFYAQVTAGKLLSLYLAHLYSTLPKEVILDQFEELERLPNLIESILHNDQSIKDAANHYIRKYRYCAVVGLGHNRSAAEEIRIKLSELCHKSIPFDILEDKKHIDLSAEALIIAIVTSAGKNIILDAEKEIARFSSHNACPIVFCDEGISNFDAHAAAVIKLPTLKYNLNIITTTVAGHLFAFYCATSLHSAAHIFKKAITKLQNNMPKNQVKDVISEVLASIAKKDLNSSLSAHYCAKLALYSCNIDDTINKQDELIQLLEGCYLETLRYIDTIKHQAKSVTVGIAR